MPRRPLAPLASDVSRIVLGTASFAMARFDAAAQLLDAWLEMGGNAIDTAEVYAGGESERVIGRWLAESGRRDEVVIITKGAHPRNGRNRLGPDELDADLETSLDRLGVTHVDVWMLHRDDPSRPVGAVLDHLSRWVADGRVGAIGASNWTTGRLSEAAAYARDHGVAGFAISSPNLSLATQGFAPWPDCVSASDAASRAWYRASQLPVLAWSAAAGGYFAHDTITDDVLAQRPALAVYDGAENRKRSQRAQALGREVGMRADQVALAWVLSQPFPTFAVVGPTQVEHLRSNVAAAGLHLTDAEIAWLTLETDSRPVA